MAYWLSTQKMESVGHAQNLTHDYLVFFRSDTLM